MFKNLQISQRDHIKLFKQKIKTRMKTSCKCETILNGLEEAAAIAGGVEEVVDGVEEEDQEAQDRQHSVRVHRVPGQQRY